MRFGVWYDFRNPRPWFVPWGELYRGLLDQAVLAEELGFDSVWLSEHHFTEDGYLPSLASMLSVLAVRTSRVRLGTAVLLAPLHHPLRVAEDLAVVDQLSAGRLEVGIAPGYRPAEFSILGVPRRERGSRTDETVELLRLAWSGEPFTHHGRHFSFDDVVVTPPSFQSGGPTIWIGGSSEFAAARAARYGCGFMPDSGATDVVYERYRRDFAGEGVPRVATNRVLFAAPTREEAWELCGPHVLEQFNTYRRWFADASDADSHGGELDDVSELSTEHYFVGTPDDIVASIERSRRRYGYEELVFWARPPGMPLDVSTRSLELIAKHVVPAFSE